MSFIRQSLQILFLCESLMYDDRKCPKDIYPFGVRENIQICLSTLFRWTPIKSHLDNAVSMINSSKDDYIRIESCFFFIFTMRESAEFSVHFNEIIELIDNLSQDAPSFLIEACRRYMRDVVYYFNCLENISDGPRLVLDSIYRYFARFPDAVPKLIRFNREYSERSFDHINSDISFINNILVFCDNKSDVVSLAILMSNVLKNLMRDFSRLSHLEAIVKFYSKVLLENFTKNTNRSDSARFTLFIMTAFRIVTDGMQMVLRSDCELTIIDEDDEDICEKTSEVLTYLVRTTGRAGRFYHEDLSERLVKYYQTLGHSCLLEPFICFIENFGYHLNTPVWFFERCKVIIEHAGDFLSSRDINDHILLIKLLMLILNPILAEQYENILEKIDFGNIVELTSRGLLLEVKSTFNECHKLLTEVFIHPSFSDNSWGKCEPRPETKSIVSSLYNSHVHGIVKNCIEVILLSWRSSHVKECGNLLRAMKIAENSDLETRLAIDNGFIAEILKNFSDKISPGTSISDSIMDILNASTKEEAENLAVLIQSKLKESK
ncbi:hypothetical protein RF11_14649 [Thelohanellus kitauei]|uniref:Uncharacterized protein n=1 Tax=Thelohanellus kitauei TaxID=669202 RepID=A0A0C2MI11_THEKT|nr:hypothetical protein RF11_14649 [Thelohanellus kitauei]